MSTTFRPAPQSGSYAMECSACGTQSVQQFSSKVRVEALLMSLVATRSASAKTCPTCGGVAGGMFAAPAQIAGHVEVNLSMSHAMDVADVLGISAKDLSTGSMGAEDFTGRVLLALALSPEDAGVPAHSIPSGPWAPSGADRIMDCGRPEGYMQEVLSELLQVGEAAKAAGVAVCWE